MVLKSQGRGNASLSCRLEAILAEEVHHILQQAACVSAVVVCVHVGVCARVCVWMCEHSFIGA